MRGPCPRKADLMGADDNAFVKGCHAFASSSPSMFLPYPASTGHPRAVPRAGLAPTASSLPSPGTIADGGVVSVTPIPRAHDASGPPNDALGPIGPAGLVIESTGRKQKLEQHVRHQKVYRERQARATTAAAVREHCRPEAVACLLVGAGTEEPAEAAAAYRVRTGLATYAD